MPPRSLSATGLRRCCSSQCRYTLPFRQFHDSASQAADKPPPPKSRREAALQAHYQEIENLPRTLVRRTPVDAPSPSQFRRNATPQPMTTPSSGDNDQRTALPRHPARGGRPNMPTRGGRGGTRGGRGGGAEGRFGGRAGPEAVGAARGRSRGRGRGRGGVDAGGRRGGRRERTSDPSQDLAAKEKEVDDAIEDSFIHSSGNPEGNRLILKHDEHFSMPEEAYNYGQVVELLNAWKAVQARRANFNEYKDSPASFGGGTPLTSRQISDMSDTLDARELEIDGLIAGALRSLATTDAKFFPHHAPQEGSSAVAIERGQSGGVPTGKQGMAGVLEEALRALAHRQTMEWQDPKRLAQDLLDGKFVKFRDYVEKSSVVRLAEEMQWQDGQRYRDEHVGFREPEPEAKKDLVRRLMSGWYADAEDAQMQSAFLKNAARLAHFNSTYTPENKRVLVSTLAEMMPQGKQGQGQGKAQSSAAQKDA